MPPNSTSLLQEGAQFVSFKIVERGQFKEKGENIIELIKKKILLLVFFVFKN
jgi:N-methylhydantoinase B/oxoprolinase/acetone carboxylase alpha subunit